MDKKAYIIVIVVLTLAVISIGGIWIWEKNIERQSKQQLNQLVPESNQVSSGIEDWKSLSDDGIGINMKFPTDWEGKIVTSSDKSVIKVIQIERKGAIKGTSYESHGIAGGDYLFSIRAYNSSSSAAKEFKGYLDNPDKFSSKIDFGNKVNLSDGTEALRNVIEGPGKTFDDQRGNNITYSFLKNGKYYEVAIVYDGNGMSNGVGEKIFSTLIFTK